MKTKTFTSIATLALVLPMAHAMAETADRIDATNTLPNAKPGECYSKVIIPAQYSTKATQVLIKGESETVKIIPAVFDTVEKSIVVKPGYTTIKAISAKFKEEIEKVETVPARTQWVTNLGRKGMPASPSLLAGAKSGGVDIANALVGACYKEYYVPASYKQTEKSILVKEAFEQIKVTPAAFNDGSETVVVKQATKEKVYQAAVYQTVEETVEVEPAKTIWKKGTGPITRVDNSTGEIMCLVEVPAKFETFETTTLKTPSRINLVDVAEKTKAIETKVLASDATVNKISVPAEYKTVAITSKTADASFSWTQVGEKGAGTYTGNQVCLKGQAAKFTNVKKLVIASAAGVDETKVVEESKTIKVSNVVTEAKEVKSLIPAEYSTVDKRTQTASERLEWRRVLCETNMTAGINQKIQSALKSQGTYNGPIDGIFGRGTMTAIEAYQKEKGLATGGLTIDVLEKLGVM